MIQAYIQKLKASEAALPLEQRKSPEDLHNKILDKFVEFSGGKHKGHVQGQGCTSSFIQRTPSGYVDVSSHSFNSSGNMSTGRSAPVESLAEIEQRIRAENQQALADMRDQLRAEWAAELRARGGQEIPFGNESYQQQQRQQQHQQQSQQQQRQQQQIPLQNQSDQLQLQRQRQRRLMQHRLNPQPEVQRTSISVGRNPQLSSSYQPDQLHEDEYRPRNVAMDNLDEPDQSFFDDLQNEPLLQSMIGDEDFEIPGFTNASHHDPAAWNQGGEIPFLSGGHNIQVGGNAFINQSGGARTPFLGNIQGGTINEFNVGGGRTSAERSGGGSASGGRTSGRTTGSATSGGRTRGRSGGRTSGN